MSTIDDSLNKINKNLNPKKRNNSHFKTIIKEENFPNNKLLNNTIRFHKKIYSIKNLSRQSSTFLILPKHKNSIEYLKTLCNNLKICKNYKKQIKQCETNSTINKLFNLNKDKKYHKKSNKIKTHKSIKDNQYIYSLFRKSQKENYAINQKQRVSGKSTNSNIIKFIQNENN